MGPADGPARRVHRHCHRARAGTDTARRDRSTVTDGEETPVHIDLTDAQATTLLDLLDAHLGDMSTEIAATDNPGYRKGLRERRDQLRSVRAALAGTDERVPTTAAVRRE